MKLPRWLLILGLVAPAQSATAPTQARIAAQHASEGPSVLVVANAQGEVETEVRVEGREVETLLNGNLLILDVSGALCERRALDGRRVWSLPGEPIETFTLLDGGGIAVIREGRLEIVNRLGDVSASEELPAIGAGSRLLRVPGGASLLVAHASGAVTSINLETLTNNWHIDGSGAALRSPAAATDGWTGISADGEVVSVQVQGEDSVSVKTILTANALRELGLASPRVAVPLRGHGWVVAAPRLDSASGLIAVELGADLIERHRIALPEATTCWVLDDGPEAGLLQRARAVHASTLTLDTHKDISSNLASTEAPDEPAALRRFIRRNDPRVWGGNQVDFPKMRSGGLDVAFFIVYVGQGALDADAFMRARAAAETKFDAIERMANRFPEDIGLARSADDVERMAAEGRLVACIGIENGYVMGDDLSAIEHFHRRGARYMSLTHNKHSQLGDSNTPADEPLHGGLSDLGRRAIEEMNRVGIMVDISHASEQTSLQAIAHSKAPVLASHSGVDAVRLHGRNLSDAELDALKANGGVVQCVAFASYVKDNGDRRAFIREARAELGLPPQQGSRQASEDPEVRRLTGLLRDRVRAFDDARIRANVSDFVDHIDYAVERIGVDHVAISSDFDGGGGVMGWSNASETFNVTLELVRRGYTATDIEKIWSKNTLRVWRAVESVAATMANPQPERR